MSTLKVNTLEEATSGGATYYTAKAWAVLDGTGSVNVTDGGNVSSLTDNGTGTYTMSYSTAFASSTYSWVGTVPHFTDNTKRAVNIFASAQDGTASVKTTSATKMRTGQTNSLNSFDTKNICITVVA